MLRDLLTLARLRSRLFAGSVRLWLGFLGYDVEDRSMIQRIYGVYVFIFLVIWLTLMASWSLYTAGQVGRALTPGAQASGLSFLPWLLFGAFVALLLYALRGSPLKLSFQDIAYVAGSPLDRRAVVLDGMLRVLLLALPVAGWLLVLVGVVLAEPTVAGGVEAVGWRLGGVGLAWIVAAVAAMWLLGIARLRLTPSRRLLLWLVPVALVALAAVFPAVGLWPEIAVVAAAQAFSSLVLATLVIVSGMLIGGLLAISANLNLIDVADESQGYAQLRAVGMYALLDPSLARRAYQQGNRRGPKRLRGKLPAWQGAGAIIGRGMVGFSRRPLPLLTSLVWSAALLTTGARLLLGNPPIQTLVTWLFAVLLVPPSGVSAVFRADVEQAFLRQFLPVDMLRLFLGESVPALVAVLIGIVVGVAFQASTGMTLPMFLLSVALGAVLALCQALSLIPINRRGARVPYAVLVLLTVGLLCLFSRAAPSFAFLLVGALFLVLVLSQRLRSAG